MLNITYVHTNHLIRCLIPAIDLCDREVIEWSKSHTLTEADTFVRAYRMAVRSRKPQSGMTFYSDQGMAESFFKSLKCKLIYGNKLLSAEHLGMGIFEHVEISHNKIRRHLVLKNMTIDENY